MMQAFIKGFTTPGFWEMIGFLCAFLGALIVYVFGAIGIFIVIGYIMRRVNK